MYSTLQGIYLLVMSCFRQFSWRVGHPWPPKKQKNPNCLQKILLNANEFPTKKLIKPSSLHLAPRGWIIKHHHSLNQLSYLQIMISNRYFNLENISTPGNTMSCCEYPLWMNQRTSTEMVAPSKYKLSMTLANYIVYLLYISDYSINSWE